MKKHFTMAVMAVLLVAKGYSQHYYALETGTKPYADLVTPTAITLDDPQGGGRYFSYDLQFKTFDKNADFKAKGTTSLGAFIAFDGYLAVYNQPTESHTVIYQVILPDTSATLVMKNNSGLNYKYEGTKGSGILKVEWKKFGFTNRHDSEYISFQAWFDEKDKSITYHYGPHNLGKNFVFFSGVFSTPNAQFGTFDKAVNLSGDAANPSLFAASGFSGLPFLTSFPPQNYYYKFREASAANSIGEAGTSAQMQVYPNPASNALTIMPAYAGVYTYALTDITGRKVLQSLQVEGKQCIDVSSVSEGIYYLAIEQEGATNVQKIMVRK